MTFWTEGVVPWNSLDDNTRAPLTSELESGYPCGEADQQLFNWTAGYPVGQIWNVLVSAGLTPDVDNLLDLSRAIQSQKMNFAVSGGTAAALTASLNPAPTTLKAGMEAKLKMATACVGNTTLNINGLGAVQIRQGGLALAAKTWAAGDIVRLVFDGSYWQMPGLSGLSSPMSAFTQIMADNAALSVPTSIATIAPITSFSDDGQVDFQQSGNLLVCKRAGRYALYGAFATALPVGVSSLAMTAGVYLNSTTEMFFTSMRMTSAVLNYIYGGAADIKNLAVNDTLNFSVFQDNGSTRAMTTACRLSAFRLTGA